MTTCAVIGSNCFTGSHVVDALLQDPANDVVGISRSPEKSALYLPYKSRDVNRWTFYQMDLVRQAEAVQTLLDELQPAYVINVAALSEVALSNTSPVEYFETNTVGVVRLGNFLRTRPYLKQYVHVSSAEVYGSCQRPVTEDAPLRPSTPYAVSKAAADLYLLTLAKNFNFPVVIVRSTNVYGKHQQLFKIIPRTIIKIRQGERVPLHGGGTAIKSFVHVRDVVRGALAAMRHGTPGATYHFSVADDRTVADVVRLIGGLLGRPFEEIAEPVADRVGQDARYQLDCSKALRELGWTPQMALEEGLRDVVAWIEESWEALMQEPLVYVHRA